MNKKGIYEAFKRNPKDVRFEMLCKGAELFGFKLRGVKAAIGYTSKMV